MPIGLIYSGFQLGAPINAEADASGGFHISVRVNGTRMTLMERIHTDLISSYPQ
jgi:hypothetical protein